jgi:Flp pilus assembly CpaF family ATPase
MQSDKRKRWDTLKQTLHRELVEELNIRRIDLDTKGDPTKERQLRTNVESTVNALIGKQKDISLARDERENLVRELVDEALGLGPLEELLRDPTITEIMVNRFDQVFIERKGKIVLSDKRFIDNNHVVQVIRRIIAPLGRRIDESVPMVDARLRDGSRVNAIIPPLSVQGPALTIRRFPEKAFSAEDLIRMGSISREMVDFLKICVLTKKNIVISGGTGTGKTTILNMLSGFIPGDERIVTVEDTAELRLQQEHVVRLEARPANIEGQGQVAIRDLVKNCLRMRPDRIVVGECRGGEALDMLQAMNTGHDGSLTTIHANSPRDAFTRMETLCLMAGMDLPVWALREQIRSAIHIIIQLSRLQDGSRRITCITEITGRTDESITTQDLFRFVQDSVDSQGHVVGHHEPVGVLPTFAAELKSKGLALDPKLFGVES